MEMRGALVTIVIVVLLAASSSIPLCEIACSVAEAGRMPAEGLTALVASHCHEGAGETGNGGKSSSQHPCENGLQHRTELSTPVASQIAAQFTLLAKSFGGPSPALAEGTIFGAAAGSATGESIFLSTSRVFRTPLLI